MKAKVLAVFCLCNAAFSALVKENVTGKTPPPIACEKDLCSGKSDGNYEIPKQPNYFLQCSDGHANCQACWPKSLIFKQKCNQCMYNESGVYICSSNPCSVTESWVPITTFYCPDICPERGPNFTGNMADHYNPFHYVGCFKGLTVGCIACPSGLMFNETCNRCLYEGKHVKQPIGNNMGGW